MTRTRLAKKIRYTLCINYAGGVFMCRRNHLRGALLLGLGLGVLVGYMLESWLLCCGGGIALVGCGVIILSKK